MIGGIIAGLPFGAYSLKAILASDISFSVAKTGTTRETDNSQTFTPTPTAIPQEISPLTSPPQTENKPAPTPQPEEASNTEPKTGIELIDRLGLRNKIVYIVYGRPKKYGEQTWGSLGETQTAEESWELLKKHRESVAKAIGKDPNADFALNIINPVYRAPNGPIENIYVQKALEIAKQERGLVALNFNSIEDALITITVLEQFVPETDLARMAIGLDVEHFPGRCANSSDINEFSASFARRHQRWAKGQNVPGIVFAYTFGRGKINNLDKLTQYYLPQQTLVVTVFDGFGTKEAKLANMAQLVNNLPGSAEYPQLVGVMEFQIRWDDKYDSASVAETFSTLEGAPSFFFASQ